MKNKIIPWIKRQAARIPPALFAAYSLFWFSVGFIPGYLWKLGKLAVAAIIMGFSVAAEIKD
jgi:hypothetical protein